MPTPAEAARRLVAVEGPILVFTGAGVSKESGVPTFRDAMDGLWARFSPEELASPQAFQRDPARVWEWYAYRRSLVQQAAPNPAHYAIAHLEQEWPHPVRVVTQNVDGFHQQAGSQDVIELHGNIWRTICSRDRQPVTEDELAGRGDIPPRCPACQALCRPDVVWFGESLPEAALEAAFRLAQGAAAILTIGTSGVVYPAAYLPQIGREQGAWLLEVNPVPSALSPLMDLVLKAPAGEALPKLVEAVLREA